MRTGRKNSHANGLATVVKKEFLRLRSQKKTRKDGACQGQRAKKNIRNVIVRVFELTGGMAMSRAFKPVGKVFAKDQLKRIMLAPTNLAAIKEYLTGTAKALGTEVTTEMMQDMVTMLFGRAAQHTSASLMGAEAGNKYWYEKIPEKL